MSMSFTMRRGDKMVYLELLIWRDGGTLVAARGRAETRLHRTLLVL